MTIKATGSPREEAKSAVIKSDTSDIELDEALSDAHNLQLELQKENNRHVETMHEKKSGVLGMFFGNQSNAASFSAMIFIVFGVAGAAYFVLSTAPDNQAAIQHADKMFERCLAAAGGALAYLFGKGSS